MAGSRKRSYYKRKLHFKTPDRILLHLLDYVGQEGGISLPDDLTQFGIADSIGLGRTTVSKTIRRLIKRGAIRSERAHVPSGKVRRTVYLLTEAGVALANARSREMEEEVVRFREAPGSERSLRLGSIPNLLPQYATLLQVAKHVSEGVFDLTSFRPTQHRFVDATEGLPRLRYFFGREKELAATETWLESSEERVLVMTGMPGIGKTTLVARKFDDWRDRRHLLFRRIMPWTTLRGLVRELSDFLGRLSKKGLAHYVESMPAPDIEQVVEILKADLDGVPAVLAYDDYHNANPAIQDFFYAFRAMLAQVDGPKLVVAGRQVRPFYDRRDVRVRAVVREIALRGLDDASTIKLLEARNLRLLEKDLKPLLGRAGGHPLFLELADFSRGSGIEDIHRFLNEELFSRITEVEARVLTLASVFRGPVPVEALYEEEGVAVATVRGLIEQSLLREISSNVCEVHDLVRSFLLEAASPRERRRLHRIAARYYLSAPAPNTLEALFHLLEADDISTAAGLAVKEGRALLRRETTEILAILDRLAPRVEDPAQSLELRLLRALALDTRGELDGAVHIYREILEQGAPERKVAEAHHRLGDIYRRLGEYASAETRLEAGLALYRASKDGAGEAQVLHALAALAESRGDVGRAEKLADRSRSLARKLGMRDLEAELEVAAARYLDHRGSLDESIERRKHAFALAESLGDWHLLAKLHISLGTGYYSAKKFAEAATEYEVGIQIARRTGNLRMLAFGLLNAAGVYLAQEDYAKGEPSLKEAGELFRRLGDPVSGAIVLQYEGTMWSRRGKWGLGKAKLLESVDRLRRASSPVDLVRCLYGASWQLHLHGEGKDALRRIDEAIAIARKLRMNGLVDEMLGYRGRYSSGDDAGSRGTPSALVVPS